jgi:abortive infection bacteriophage resistance protein
MLKTPLNVPQQLSQFQSHGVLVQDEAAALSILERVSYYRLSGYALEFRTSAHSDRYTPGTTIEQIYDRYRFDEDLRHILRKYLEIAEIFYRTQIANIISLRKCSQPPHEQHYDSANYYRKEYFQDLMVQLRKQLHYYKDSLFIQHHMGKYHGRMPLWVLVEVMSLSMLSKYYSCLYRSDQEAIAIPLHTSARTHPNKTIAAPNWWTTMKGTSYGQHHHL